MLCLSGRGSVLSSEHFPHIDLRDGEYEVGLIDFMTYNNIPNVQAGKNNLFCFDNGKRMELPEGMYEVSDLHLKIKHGLASFYDDDCPPAKKARSEGAAAEDTRPLTFKHKKQKDALPEEEEVDLRAAPTRPAEECIDAMPIFKMDVDPTTMRCRLYSDVSVDFTVPGTIRTLLGFDETVLQPHKWHMSRLPVNISAVNVIRITCNVVRGSYTNGAEGHTLHEFFPKVERGYKIIETPRNVIYLPVNTRRIANVTVRIEDQDGKPVHFQDETVSLRLHLRKRPQWG